MKAIQFGAGNIGRGFIGKMLAVTEGVELTFTDINQELIDCLNKEGEYVVRLVGEVEKRETIKGFKALNSNSPEIVQLIAEAGLITTAVGPNILSRIAVPIAKGLKVRHTENPDSSLNIIACENAVRATLTLKGHILKLLPEELHNWVDQKIGFVDTIVDRIVPPKAPNAFLHKDDLEVIVEEFKEWIVDKTQVKEPWPAVKGVEMTDNLMAFIERKLLTLNTGHAITGYLGHLAGYESVRQAILDPKILQVVRGAMQESGEVLIKRYGLNEEAHMKYIEKILGRFRNPHIDDELVRVGRQPMRKLGVKDRLIMPLLGAVEYNLPRHYLLSGVAAALLYDYKDDPEAVTLQELITTKGLEATIQEVCGLEGKDDLIAEIVKSVSTCKEEFSSTTSKTAQT